MIGFVCFSEQLLLSLELSQPSGVEMWEYNNHLQFTDEKTEAWAIIH